MSDLIFAGTLVGIRYGKDDSNVAVILKFNPDSEYTASRKVGDSSVNTVVFQPTGKWQNGVVYRYDNGVKFKTTSSNLFGLVQGVHCELHLNSDAKDALFDVELMDAPSMRLSVVSIEVL